MTNKETPPSPPSLSAAEAAAVLAVRGGLSRQRAANEAGLPLEEVDAALKRAEANRAQRAVPAGISHPRRVPVDQEPGPTPIATTRLQSSAGSPDGIDELLRWAATSYSPRAQTLAARAHTIIEELRDLQGRGEKIRIATKAIEVLERQLQRAKDDLRAASGKPAPKPATKTAADDSPTREERVLIRAWAAKNNHFVADRGKIPETVVTVYRAALTGQPT